MNAVKKAIALTVMMSSLHVGAAVYPGDKDQSGFANPHAWTLVSSIGYTHFDQVYESDGQTPIIRLAFGRQLFAFKPLVIGLETGAQTGNTMRLDASYYPELGGLPVQSSLKTMVDILATIKTVRFGKTPFFAEVKGGAAYLHWQFDNNTDIDSQTDVAKELQAGLGYFINDHVSLSLLYQGVYGGNPSFRVDETTNRLLVDMTPVQSGVLLSLTIST